MKRRIKLSTLLKRTVLVVIAIVVVVFVLVFAFDKYSPTNNTYTNKYDDLQDQINALKEQIGRVGYSAKNAGAALKSMFNRMSNTKVSLRNQLQTITEWQTI